MSISTSSSPSHHSRHVEPSPTLLSSRDEHEVTYQEVPSTAMVPAISPEPPIFKPGPADSFSATVTSAPLPSTADSLIGTFTGANEPSLLSTAPLTSVSSSPSYSSSAFSQSNVYSSSPPNSLSGQAPHTSADEGHFRLHNPTQEAPPRRPQNFSSSSASRSAPDLTSGLTTPSFNRSAPNFHNSAQHGLTYNPTLSYSSPSLMQTTSAPSGYRSPYTTFHAFERPSVPSMHAPGRYPASTLSQTHSYQPRNVSSYTQTRLPGPGARPREFPSFTHMRYPTTVPPINPLASRAGFGVPTGIPYGAQPAFLETPIARDAMLTYAYRLYSTFIRQAEGLTSFPHQSEPDATAPSQPYQNQLLPLLTSMRNLHPHHLPILLLLSCAHYSAGDLDACLAVSNEILSIDPNYVEAMSNIGMAMKGKGALKEAETWWLKAVRLRPTYWDAIDNLLKSLCEPQREVGGMEIPPRHQEALNVVDYVVNILLRHDGLLLVMVPPAHLHRLQNLLYTGGNLRSAIRPDINAGLHDYVRALELMFCPQSSIESEDPLTFRDVIIATVIIGLLACHPHDSALLHAIADELSIDSSRFNRGMLDRSVDWLQLVHRNSQRVVDVLLREGDGALPMVLLPPEKVERLLDSLFSAFSGKLPALCTRSSYEEPWQLAPAVHSTKEAESVTASCLLAIAKFLQYKRGTTVPNLFGHGKELPPGQSLILPLYYLAVSFDPSPSTYNNMGILLCNVKRTSNIINAHGLRETMNGTSLAKLYYSKGLAMEPNHVHLLTNYGSLLKDQGRSLEAITMYQRALTSNPNFDIALANIANALKESGRIDESIEYYQRALAVSPEFPDAVCGLVNTLSSVCDWRGGRGSMGNEPIVNENLEYLPRKDDGDRTSYGWMGKLETLTRRQVQEMYSRGTGVVQMAGSIKDWLNVVEYAYGSRFSHAQLRRWDKLFRRFYTDFNREENAVNEIGFVIRLVEVMNRVLQRRWYNDAHGGAQRHWSEKTVVSPGYRRARLPGSLEPPPVPSVLPFHTFTYAFDDRLLRIIAYRNALGISYQALTASWLPSTVFEPPPPPSDKINIGYISSDFNNHPLTHLMLSVFRMHDREKFNVHIYATSSSDNSYYRQNIEKNAQTFRDFSSSSIQAMVEQIIADKIHILVNLGGYTKGARNEVFAVRPCPVQVALMGYAGTSAASWCDYLIADAHAAPAMSFAPYRQAVRKEEGQETLRMQDGFAELDLESEITEENADPESFSLDWTFTEKFVHMPHSYFVTDHRQAFREDDHFDSLLSPDETWSLEERFRYKLRRQMFPDLPDNTIIFACFSQLYKISPHVFWVWTRILLRVPDSILWLLRFPSAGEDNLLRVAAVWGGPGVASRIRFTDIAKKHEHIRRCRIADLFLDTFSCNAHTVAADVLWTGTPILTWPKEQQKMGSRVASSIAYATGFGESMVVSSDTAYENRAVALAESVAYQQVTDREDGYYRRGSGELIELRRQIFLNRDKMPLFDTQRWTKNVEKAYQEMWEHWVKSCKPPWTDVDENGGCIVITDDQPFFSA